jgi:hypothetical protein
MILKATSFLEGHEYDKLNYSPPTLVIQPFFKPIIESVFLRIQWLFFIFYFKKNC